MKYHMMHIGRRMALCCMWVFIVCAAAQAATPGLNLPPVEAFIYTWQRSGGSELGSSQSFITDLCTLINVPAPDAPRPELADNTYVFEKAVSRVSVSGKASTARIDLYKRGCFIWESKQGSERVIPGVSSDADGPRRKGHALRESKAWEMVLLNARIQATDYARDLPSGENPPPFILVADIGYSIDIYANFHGSGDYSPFPSARENRFTLEDFRKPEVRDLFRAIWTDPLSLDPSREAEKVTRELALKLAALAKSLESTGNAPDVASLFIQRCLFVMFAEDCGLLPHNAFTALLATLEHSPERFAPAVTELWQAMHEGGRSDSLGKQMLRFHGSFYENAQALPLDKAQLGILLEAARANWAAVDTAIFGTLLERALSPQERHALGAHYTPTAYVERLVLPTVMEPVREEWEGVKATALTKVLEGNQAGAIEAVTGFHKRLTEIVVLDPSCGSGNFLAVTMNLMKDLEGEVVQALRSLGQSERDTQKKGYSVHPRQFRGIEVVQRAADISELVLWISYLQRHYKIHGNITPPEPILSDFRSVECRDAVLAWNTDDTARQADPWPQADYIVGNPPFVGNFKMRSALGDHYTIALRNIYKDVPHGVDYVMYWWYRAAVLVKEGKVKRFGLITTNSLRQVRNRAVLASFLEGQPPLSLVYAVPDHPWIDAADGAQVRIAMTVVAQGRGEGMLASVLLEKADAQGLHKVWLDAKAGLINANLTLGPDVSKAVPLKANAGLSYTGVKPTGAGFIVTPEQAKALGLGSVPGLERHIRLYRNGRDLAGLSRQVMVIDLHGLQLEEVQKKYPKVYQWLLEKVKPERDRNRDEYRRNNWWLFGRTNINMRKTLDGLQRYIVTPEVARRRYFVFFDKEILPDGKLIAIGSDDAYTLGVLSSSIHQNWSLATGGKLGAGNDPVYVKSITFEAFPFPHAAEGQKARIRDLAEKLDAHRKAQQSLHPKLTLTDMYAVLEQVRYGVDLTPKEQRISQQADIPTLKALHDDLDAAVADAYTWPADLPAEEVLSRLFALNQARAAEEKRGPVRWLRLDLQVP